MRIIVKVDTDTIDEETILLLVEPDNVAEGMYAYSVHNGGGSATAEYLNNLPNASIEQVEYIRSIRPNDDVSTGYIL